MAARVHPPPFRITVNDKRGLIVVTTAIVLAFVIACVFVRCWQRLEAKEWHLEDLAFASSAVLLVAETGVVFRLVSLGLGDYRSGSHVVTIERFEKVQLASHILYILTLGASKACILLLYLRLFSQGRFAITIRLVLAAAGAWTVSAIVLLPLSCTSVQHNSIAQACGIQWPSWQGLGAIDIATEILIFLIAIQQISPLQMHLKPKITIISAFSLRLPVIAIAAIRLYRVHEEFQDEVQAAATIVATQWQMGYSIMSLVLCCSGPIVRPFGQKYTTGYAKRSDYDRSVVQDDPQTRYSKFENVRFQSHSSTTSQSYLMEDMVSESNSQASLLPTHSNARWNASARRAPQPAAWTIFHSAAEPPASQTGERPPCCPDELQNEAVSGVSASSTEPTTRC